MVSLIKNELIKIFKRKAIYIVIIIAIAVAIAANLMNKFFMNTFMMDGLSDNYYTSLPIAEYDNEIEWEKQIMQNADKTTPEGLNEYNNSRANIELLELLKKYSGEDDAWKRYVISTEGQPIIYDKIANEQTEDAEAYLQKYNEFISRIEKGNWQDFVEEKLDNVNAQLESYKNAGMDESLDMVRDLKITKQALEWRIEKDIPYGSSYASNLLTVWEGSKSTVLDYEKMSDRERDRLKHEEKVEAENTQSQVHLIEEYILDHGSDKELNLENINNTYFAGTFTNYTLISAFDDLFIIIIAIMFAGTIVSTEFNKGTIKTLLVRPYTRTKILLAKFITSMIMVVFAFIVVGVIQGIVGGFVYGFDTYRANIAVFDFAKNSVVEISFIKFILLTVLSKFPKYALLATLAFSISTIIANSPIALIFTLAGYTASSIINEIAINFEKAWMLKFFVTPNWDFSVYLFGKTSQFRGVSPMFSVAICLLYFIVMIFTSFAVFKRRDIKNI